MHSLPNSPPDSKAFPTSQQGGPSARLPSVPTANGGVFVSIPELTGSRDSPQAPRPSLDMVAELASSQHHQMVQSRSSEKSTAQVLHGGRTTIHGVTSYRAATGPHPTFSTQHDESKNKFTLSEEELAAPIPSGHPQRTDAHDGNVKKDKGKRREILAEIPPSQAPQDQCDAASLQEQVASDRQLAIRLQHAEGRQLRPRTAHRGQPECVQGSSRDSEYMGKRDTANESTTKKTSEVGKATGMKTVVQKKKAPVPRTKGKKSVRSVASSVPASDSAAALHASKSANPRRSGASFANDGAFTSAYPGSLAAEQPKNFANSEAGGSIAAAVVTCGSSQPAKMTFDYSSEEDNLEGDDGINASSSDDRSSDCSDLTSTNVFPTATAKSRPLESDESEWMSTGINTSMLIGLPPLRFWQASTLMRGAEYDLLNMDDVQDFCGDLV